MTTSTDPITSAPEEVATLDLATLKPGQMIRVDTHASYFWITPINGCQVSRQHVVGVFIQHNSETVPQVTTTPNTTGVQRVATVGQTLQFYNGRQQAGRTGVITKITVQRLRRVRTN